MSVRSKEEMRPEIMGMKCEEKGGVDRKSGRRREVETRIGGPLGKRRLQSNCYLNGALSARVTCGISPPAHAPFCFIHSCCPHGGLVVNIPRVALIGLGGYGAVHLQHLRDFHRRGEIRFVAAVDFPPGSDSESAALCRSEGCQIFPGFDELL